MSAGLEHRECAEALGAYALGALRDAEHMRVRHHLLGCRECRAELDDLSGAVDALAAGVAPIEPPPELKARIMAIVEAEAPQRAPLHRRLRWSSTPAWRLALALACLAAVAIAIGLLASGGAGTRSLRAQITNPTLAGRVEASLLLRGARGELRVRGLPAPTADHVDELWVKRAGAPPEPAGTFVLQSGSVEVARPIHRGDLVLVTVERGRGAAAPTAAPFMVVQV